MGIQTLDLTIGCQYKVSTRIVPVLTFLQLLITYWPRREVSNKAQLCAHHEMNMDWSCVWNLDKIAEEYFQKSQLFFKRFEMEDLFFHRRNESNDSNVNWCKVSKV
jgi:hypothetical protein